VIQQQGRASYPNECCGILIGSWGSNGDRTVSEVRPIENARNDSPQTRYLIRPEELLRASRDAESRGLEVIGFYHSHPDVAARPSEFDREHAWPGYGYIIIRIDEGETVEARAWSLKDNRKEFEEAELLFDVGSNGDSAVRKGA
jgi:proteasome lid subunit RPN8/RPN11